MCETDHLLLSVMATPLSDRRADLICIATDLQHIQALFRGREGLGLDEDTGELIEESDMGGNVDLS